MGRYSAHYLPTIVLVCTICQLFVRYLPTIACFSITYSLFAHCLPTIPTSCPLFAHYLPTTYPLFANCLPTICVLFAHYIIICLLFYLTIIHPIFINCLTNVPESAHYVVTVSAQFVHCLPKYLFTICRLLSRYSWKNKCRN